jgi:Xaa-Pro aminopeptidase
MPHQPHHTALATAIASAKLDLYIVPMVDEFQSEYIPAYAARLPRVTGFTGSAGLGVFWAKPDAPRKHTLFVDGRYTLQAANEVDAEAIAVLNSGEVSFLDWLEMQAEGLVIGFDPWLVTQQQLEGWQKATAARGHEWRTHTPNLVDAGWDDQPAPHAGTVVLHPLELAGVSYPEKRDALLKTMEKHRADSLVLTQPDGINWLLNIRGADVDFNPLLLAHMVLGADATATLFIHSHALSAEVEEYLQSHQVRVAPMADIVAGTIDKALLGATVMMDASVTAAGWFTLAQARKAQVVRDEDPTLYPKAVKHAVELSGIRAAHARDGLALTRFLHWFDQQTQSGQYPDELGVIRKLESFRESDASYRGGSFATIAGAGAHGAIVHYRADETSSRRTRAGELFLLDSGGQYPDGTTDVTRTIFVSSPAGGAPAPRMTEHFTRVLKGHIALACAKFPAGTTGGQLDVLARHALWEAGLDYDHGTGHGVGAYLCVHEGPQRISKRGSGVALAAGMILSNEPGYYAAGQYGIRIENLVCVAQLGHMADGKVMLGFETLTLAPIDTRLVDVTMLNVHERNWLNAYHRRVYETHEPHLDDKAKQWLMQVTRAI